MYVLYVPYELAHKRPFAFTDCIIPFPGVLVVDDGAVLTSATIIRLIEVPIVGGGVDSVGPHEGSFILLRKWNIDFHSLVGIFVKFELKPISLRIGPREDLLIFLLNALMR